MMNLGKQSLFGNVEKIPTKAQRRFAIPISLVHPFLPGRIRSGVPTFPWGDGFGGVPRAKWVIPERVTEGADSSPLAA